MKQRQYTELQIEIMKVLGRLIRYLENTKYGKEEIENIKKDYGIEEPYWTIRQYVMRNCSGSYHTFHFTLNGIEVSIDSIGDMLTDEWCSLYPLTDKYYVVKDFKISNGGHCENYHCDHHLTIEPKEN